MLILTTECGAILRDFEKLSSFGAASNHDHRLVGMKSSVVGREQSRKWTD